MIGQIDTNTG